MEIAWKTTIAHMKSWWKTVQKYSGQVCTYVLMSLISVGARTFIHLFPNMILLCALQYRIHKRNFRILVNGNSPTKSLFPLLWDSSKDILKIIKLSLFLSVSSPPTFFTFLQVFAEPRISHRLYMKKNASQNRKDHWTRCLLVSGGLSVKSCFFVWNGCELDVHCETTSIIGLSTL